MNWRRFDSLFSRLLLLQVAVAVVMLLVFGGLVYVERNVAVARLVGERWAPALRQAAGWPDLAPSDLPAVLRSAQRPPQSVQAPQIAPRMAALDDELRWRGVPLQEMLIARGEHGPEVWLRVRSPDGEQVWLGLTDVALLPNVPRRLLIAVLIAALLMVGVSWVFTRRLTRPLEQLRARMQSHRPGEPVPDTAPRGATPEVAAIELAYAQLLRGLERHERERALLLAGVSHDLRSPLARIRMAASLLPDDPALTARREVIVRNTQVADRLIGSFLDHVRAGELALDERVDLAAIARHVVAATEHDPAQLQVDAPDTLWLSTSNGLLLERLLANLVDNALRHGRVPVRLRIEAQADQALIEVSDAGDGIPEDQRVVVQRAFARGDASRGTPGTGLGLAIVTRVVERMGGTIAFERVEGRHCVRVALPVRGKGAARPWP